jgi:hypothetical protein
VIIRPFSTSFAEDRIRTLIRARKPFIVTSDYIGPDRRRDKTAAAALRRSTRRTCCARSLMMIRKRSPRRGPGLMKPARQWIQSACGVCACG